MKKTGAAALIITMLLLLSGCEQVKNVGLQDGYYSAEEMQFNNIGWKEFVTIYVKGGKIVTVEYNAKNASGFVKSWDTNYMRNMNAVSGTYPNQFTREYAARLLSTQEPDQIDAITGATHSHQYFQALARAAIERSIEGNHNIAFVDISAE